MRKIHFGTKNSITTLYALFEIGEEKQNGKEKDGRHYMVSRFLLHEGSDRCGCVRLRDLVARSGNGIRHNLVTGLSSSWEAASSSHIFNAEKYVLYPLSRRTETVRAQIINGRLKLNELAEKRFNKSRRFLVIWAENTTDAAMM